ncbi:MAG: ATP-dependent helicase, partial [Thermoleophilia bacterium]
DALGPGLDRRLRLRFELPAREGEVYLARTHPIVEGLASYVLDTALDPLQDGAARRAGAIRTGRVERRTTLVLVRFRHEVTSEAKDAERRRLAEEARLLAFAGPPEQAQWLSQEEAEALLDASPDANIAPDQARDFVRRVVEGYEHLRPALEEEARRRAQALLDSHLRVRDAARLRGLRYRVEPKLPPDLLGVYVLLPVA